MIVVMPNGRAQKNDRAEGERLRVGPRVREVRGRPAEDVIPAIESRYSVVADREHRALAGLSMGGGQIAQLRPGAPRHLRLGRRLLVGAQHQAARRARPRSRGRTKASSSCSGSRCGNKDGLIRISQGVHAYLKEHDVPHIWHVDSHGHDGTEWSNNLYLFAQQLFN